MTASTLARRAGLCVPLAVLGLLIGAGASHAQATPFQGSSPPKQLSEVVDPIACIGPYAGNLTGTVTHNVWGVSSDQTFFYYHETSVGEYRIDFPNDRYVLGAFADRFMYMSNGMAPTTKSDVVQDRGTVYDAATGQPTGQVVTIHAVLHQTFTDNNHDGELDAGDDYTANVDHFSLTCG